MNIKILGSGCASCKTLYGNTEEALRQLGMEATLEKVEDFKAIAKYGVMRTPAIVVDEKVKAFGKVLTVEEIKAIL